MSDVLNDLNCALCNFINAATDPFDPMEEWSAEFKENMKRLTDAYNAAYSAGVFPPFRLPSWIADETAALGEQP